MTPVAFWKLKAVVEQHSYRSQSNWLSVKVAKQERPLQTRRGARRPLWSCLERFPLVSNDRLVTEPLTDHHLLPAHLLWFLSNYRACLLLALLLRSVLLWTVLLAPAEPGVLHQGTYKVTRVVKLPCSPCLHSPPHLKTCTQGFRGYLSPTTTWQMLGNRRHSCCLQKVNGQWCTRVYSTASCGPTNVVLGVANDFLSSLLIWIPDMVSEIKQF